MVLPSRCRYRRRCSDGIGTGRPDRDSAGPRSIHRSVRRKPHRPDERPRPDSGRSPPRRCGGGSPCSVSRLTGPRGRINPWLSIWISGRSGGGGRSDIGNAVVTGGFTGPSAVKGVDRGPGRRCVTVRFAPRNSCPVTKLSQVSQALLCLSTWDDAFRTRGIRRRPTRPPRGPPDRASRRR